MTVAIKINVNDGRTTSIMVGGETEVDFDFPIFDAEHLTVYETDTGGTITQLVKDTDYTVPAGSVNQQAGGTIDLDPTLYPSGATAGHEFNVYQSVPYARTTDFNQAGDFLADTLNQELDLVAQMFQQVTRDLSRAVLLQEDTTNSSLTLPEPSTGKGIKWNASGDFENTTFDLDDALTAAAASAAAAATSETNAASSASAAATSASNASTSETNAGTSETNAASSAGAASASATTATNYATAAATSASTAQTAQSAAETAETNAETAQTAAEAAQSAAETAETNAEAAQSAAETAETNAGTSETNAASSASSASSSATAAAASASVAQTKIITMGMASPTEDVATGNAQAHIYIPAIMAGMVITSVHAEVITAGTTGTMSIQLHNLGLAADILSTALTIDSTETGSDTAATPAVINTSNDHLTEGDVLRLDIDAIHTTPAKGLIVTIEAEVV